MFVEPSPECGVPDDGRLHPAASDRHPTHRHRLQQAPTLRRSRAGKTSMYHKKILLTIPEATHFLFFELRARPTTMKKPALKIKL